MLEETDSPESFPVKLLCELTKDLAALCELFIGRCGEIHSEACGLCVFIGKECSSGNYSNLALNSLFA